MALRLKNSSGNYIALDAPSSIATDVTLTLPNTDGDSGQYLQTDGAGALSWQTVTDTNTQGYTFLAAGTLSGNQAVTVDSIPTTSTEISIFIRNVSNNDAAGRKVRLRMGNGTVDSGANYTYSVSCPAVGYNVSNGDDHYLATMSGLSGAANAFDGIIWCVRLGASGEWVISSSLGTTANNNPPTVGGGSYANATAVDRVQVSCGSGTFDSGSFVVGYK